MFEICFNLESIWRGKKFAPLYLSLVVFNMPPDMLADIVVSVQHGFHKPRQNFTPAPHRTTRNGF